MHQPIVSYSNIPISARRQVPHEIHFERHRHYILSNLGVKADGTVERVID